MNCPDAEDYCLIYSAFISYHCIFSQASALTPHLHCIHSHYRQFSRGRLRCCNHEIVLKTGPQREKTLRPRCIRLSDKFELTEELWPVKVRLRARNSIPCQIMLLLCQIAAFIEIPSHDPMRMEGREKQP